MMLLTQALFALGLQPPPNQGEFIPLNELPASEKLPAAPFLIAAYAFVWVAVMFYLWTIWRRLNKVEADLDALTRKIPPR